MGATVYTAYFVSLSMQFAATQASTYSLNIRHTQFESMCVIFRFCFFCLNGRAAPMQTHTPSMDLQILSDSLCYLYLYSFYLDIVIQFQTHSLRIELDYINNNHLLISFYQKTHFTHIIISNISDGDIKLHEALKLSS